MANLKIGQRITVHRKRGTSYSGTISNITDKAIILVDLSGLDKKYYKARVSRKAVEEGRIGIGSKPAKAKAGRKASVKKDGRKGKTSAKKASVKKASVKKASVKKASAKTAAGSGVRICVQTRRGYQYQTFPASVVPSGMMTEKEAKRVEGPNFSLDLAEWREFTHNGHRYLGRFM